MKPNRIPNKHILTIQKGKLQNLPAFHNQASDQAKPRLTKFF